MMDSGLAGRGAVRAEDAQVTPTQSHVSTSILVYEDNLFWKSFSDADNDVPNLTRAELAGDAP